MANAANSPLGVYLEHLEKGELGYQFSPDANVAVFYPRVICPLTGSDNLQWRVSKGMGTVHATRAVLGGMVARGFGRVVAVASTAGLKGYGYVSAYCAAKHAVVGLVRSLALETATSGVTVNAVCPGYTDTALVEDSLARITAKTGRSRDDALAIMLQGSPLGRLVKPEEVAAAVLFLCSPDAAAITGTTLAVAGGEV